MKHGIALDMPSPKDNRKRWENIKNTKDIWVKGGLRSFIRDGKDCLYQIKSIGDFKIFLDLKLYDIPNTMGDSIDEITKLPIDMLTIHASSGREAMQEVIKRIQPMQNPPLIMAVTALTSFNQESFYEIYNANLESQEIEFAKITIEYRCNRVFWFCLVYKAIK